ncbi:hypothetical protein EMIT0P291_170115 [Pseudomonas sp. IT-P291]
MSSLCCASSARVMPRRLRRPRMRVPRKCGSALPVAGCDLLLLLMESSEPGWGPQSPVGASLLAMVANDNAGSLTPSGVLGFIASRLAPTGLVLAVKAPEYKQP